MIKVLSSGQRHEDIILSADVTVGQRITAHDPVTGRPCDVCAGVDMHRGERIWIDVANLAWPRQWIENYRVGGCE